MPPPPLQADALASYLNAGPSSAFKPGTSVRWRWRGGSKEGRWPVPCPRHHAPTPRLIGTPRLSPALTARHRSRLAGYGTQYLVLPRRRADVVPIVQDEWNYSFTPSLPRMERSTRSGRASRRRGATPAPCHPSNGRSQERPHKTRVSSLAK